VSENFPKKKRYRVVVHIEKKMLTPTNKETKGRIGMEIIVGSRELYTLCFQLPEHFVAKIHDINCFALDIGHL
jgi:hypothetical protein